MFPDDIQSYLINLYMTVRYIMEYGRSNLIIKLISSKDGVHTFKSRDNSDNDSMIITTGVPYSTPKNINKINQLFQSVIPFKLNDYYKYSVIATMIRIGLIDEYIRAYVKGEKPSTLDNIKRKQIDEKLMHESKMEYLRKYSDEIVYRQIYEQKFGKKAAVLYTSILDGLTDDMKSLILREKDMLDILIEEIRSNNCPHISLYNKYIRSGDVEDLEQLKAYFKGGVHGVNNQTSTQGGDENMYESNGVDDDLHIGKVGGESKSKSKSEPKDTSKDKSKGESKSKSSESGIDLSEGDSQEGYIYCNNCNFKIMCEHILHKDDLEKYKTESPINGSYYCRICNEYLGDADYTTSFDESDRRLYSRVDDPVQSFLWRQVYFSLKIVKWKGPAGATDDAIIRKHVASITNTLYPFAKDVYDTLSERKADTFEVLESKRRVYMSLYIFGYLWKLSETYPDRLELTPLNTLTGQKLVVAHFIQTFNKDIHSLKLSHKSIEEALKNAHSKVSSDFSEEEPDKHDYTKVLMNPIYSYIWSTNTIDVLLNGGKVPGFDNTQFLLGKELNDNIFYSTFKKPREPNWSKWRKIVRPSGWNCKETIFGSVKGDDKIDKLDKSDKLDSVSSKSDKIDIYSLESASQACYYDIMKESYTSFIDYIHGKSLDIKNPCVGYYFYFNLFNRPTIRKLPFRKSIQFKWVDVDIIPVDYDRVGFFNYYSVRCPKPDKSDVHVWGDQGPKPDQDIVGDTCTQCLGKRDELVKREDSYYNKYNRVYNQIINNNINTEKEYAISRLKEGLVTKLYEVPTLDIKDIERNLGLFVDKFYDDYKNMVGSKWSRKEFTNAITYIGVAENNSYENILSGKPTFINEYNRRHAIKHHIFNMIIDCNLIRNGVQNDELQEIIKSGKTPNCITISHDDNMTSSYLLNIMMDYLSKQDKEFSLFELNKVLTREKLLALPTLVDLTEYKAYFSSQGEFSFGDDEKKVEERQEQKTYYDFDQGDRPDADTDEAIFI